MINGYPRNIIANVYGSNEYAYRIIQLLKNKGYDLPGSSIEAAKLLVSRGYDATFIKSLANSKD